MRIEHITGSRLEEFITGYNPTKEAVLFTNEWKEKVQKETQLIVASDNQNICGLLSYVSIVPESTEEISKFMTKHLGKIYDKNGNSENILFKLLEHITLKQYQAGTEIAYLEKLESFQKGTGSILVRELQTLVQTIFLSAAFDSKPFYEQHRFCSTDIYHTCRREKNSPEVMLWSGSSAI